MVKFFEIFQKYFMKYFRAKKNHEILHHYLQHSSQVHEGEEVFMIYVTRLSFYLHLGVCIYGCWNFAVYNFI